MQSYKPMRPFFLKDILHNHHKESLSKEGIFNSSIIKDSAYYINVFLLKQTDIDKFKSSYEKIINRFMEIMKNIYYYSKKGDITNYENAKSLMEFGEVSEINLGYGIKSSRGKGMGKKIINELINNIKYIIKQDDKFDYKKPTNNNIMFISHLFTDDMGPDRISDMVANIIIEDIESYTLEMMAKIGIDEKSYRCKLKFNNKGFIMNPNQKNERILFLPKSILSSMNFSHSWESTERFCSECNDKTIKTFEEYKLKLDKEILDKWHKKKENCRKEVVKGFLANADNREIVMKDFNSQEIKEYDFREDPIGDITSIKLAKKLVKFTLSDIFNIDKKIKSFTKKNDYDLLKTICYLYEKSLKVILKNTREYNKLQQRNIQNILYLYSEEILRHFNINCEINITNTIVKYKFRNKKEYEINIKTSNNHKLISSWKKQHNRLKNSEVKQIYLVVSVKNDLKYIDKLEDEKNKLKNNSDCNILNPEIKYIQL